MSQLLLDGKTLVREPVAGVCVFSPENPQNHCRILISTFLAAGYLSSTHLVLLKDIWTRAGTPWKVWAWCVLVTPQNVIGEPKIHLIYTFDLQVQNLMNGMSCFLAFQRAKKSERVNPRFVGYLHQYNVGKQNLKTLTTDYSHFIL